MVLLKPGFSPRRYQETILSSAAQQNTLVVLPTGMGKTAIAALLAAHRLDEHAHGKIVFLAPTKPLAQQHLDTFRSLFDFPDDSFALFTGHVPPEKRAKLWKEATFVFSTPQGMENDLISRRLHLDDVALLVFDEAHRALGDYAYVFIAQHYHKHALHERILGLTASPGSDEETIKAVCQNLFIDRIEVRSQEDPDVAQYVQDLDITFKNVPLSEDLLKLRGHLQRCHDNKLADAQAMGVLKVSELNKTGLLRAQAALHAKTAQGEKGYEVLKTISLLAEALKVQHALELCETQTVAALSAYLESLRRQAEKTKVKAVQNLVKDPDFKSAAIIADRLLGQGEEHPKVTALQSLVTQELLEDDKKKLIVFTQFRDTAAVLKRRLQEIASAEVFVGQAKRNGTGLSQKQQQAMLQRFRDGDFQVLIATSVAEEGLDIPAVDAVVFYEPIPSAIRTVQRRGRTGRQEAGKVYLLITKGTRDEGYRWSAHHKEKRMYRAIEQLQRSFTPTANEQPTLQDYGGGAQELTITVDYREKGSPVMKSLLAQDAKLDLEQLRVGDYRISDDVVVEYKTVKDFVDSIVDGRLLGQLSELRTVYKPVLIIEGLEDLYAQRRVNPAAIRGMLATIVTSYHIPLLRTTSPVDTAGVLLALARRAHKDEDPYYHPHTSKPWSLREQQEYVVSSLPGIGPRLAKPLLERFGSVRGVLEASSEELQEVELIGEKKAKAIRDLLEAAYSLERFK
ncbi:DEAD/DEAH box helicase [Candidatus Woesearchaeota archaeon]|nr:DEAD/DEAH box helicase [Candidatus Woesearchaeota archaeon]